MKEKVINPYAICNIMKKRAKANGRRFTKKKLKRCEKRIFDSTTFCKEAKNRKKGYRCYKTVN